MGQSGHDVILYIQKNARSAPLLVENYSAAKRWNDDNNRILILRKDKGRLRQSIRRSGIVIVPVLREQVPVILLFHLVIPYERLF